MKNEIIINGVEIADLDEAERAIKKLKKGRKKSLAQSILVFDKVRNICQSYNDCRDCPYLNPHRQICIFGYDLPKNWNIEYLKGVF